MQSYNELLAQCQSIPVMTPGKIQPHGALFAVNKASGLIEFISENAPEFLGIKPDECLDSPFTSALHPYFETISLAESDSQLSRADDRDIRASASETHLIIEVCPASLSTSDIANCVAQWTGELVKAQDVDALHTAMMGALQTLTGYGHLMVYQFDDKWNGQVVAETIDSQKREVFSSYLGLRFPESDIPRQAREMYRHHWVRNTADVAAMPVALASTSKQALNMSGAYLRGIAPSHIQYLKNMGVVASFSCSILVEGELWGLVAAHDDNAQCLDASTLQAAEQFAKLYSVLLEMGFRKKRQQRLAEHNALLQWPGEMASQGKDPFNSADSVFAELIACFDACGVVIWDGGLKKYHGVIPAEESIRDMISVLRDQEFKDNIASTNELAKWMQADDQSIAGLLALGVPKDGERFVLLFRKEEPQEISWGGDPRIEQLSIQNGLLSPRNSFKVWKETLSGMSRPWREAERDLAITLALNLNLANSTLGTMENAQKSAKLNLLNMLLHDIGNALSGVMGHVTEVRHLQEDKDALLNLQKLCGFIEQQLPALEGALGPAKAKGLLQLLQEITRSGTEKAEHVGNALTGLETGMTHARELLDLQKTYAQSSTLYARECHISHLISDALSVLRTSIEHRGSLRTSFPSNLPMLNVDRSKLMQVIINLIKNAFEAWDARQEPKPAFLLLISAEVEEKAVILKLKDNGVGLTKDSAARLFETNFSTKERSSGLGLANCKRLAKATGVELKLESEGLNMGVTALLVFPEELWV